MTQRHLALLTVLISIWLGPGQPLWANVNTFPPPQNNTDVITEMDFVSQLEARLGRDIRAFLGHDRFIINVDVRIQQVRTVTPTTNQQFQLSPEQQKKLDSLNQLINQLEVQAQEQVLASTPDTVQLPGLPFSRDSEVAVPEPRPDTAMLDSLKEMRESLMGFQSEDGITEEVLHTSQDVFAQVDNMVVTLLVDDGISLSQEEFLKSLIENKLNINYFRGDKLAIVRTTFESLVNELSRPLEEEPTPEAAPSDSNEAQESSANAWMQQYFPHLLLTLLGLMVLLMVLQLMRKQRIHQSQPEIGMPTPAPMEPPPTLKDDQQPVVEDIRSLKQDIITAGLGQPERTSAKLEDLLMSGNQVRPLAAAYQVLGGSLFRGLFPSLSTGQIYEINQYLEENTLSSDDIHSELSALKHLMLSNQQGSLSHNPAKPFQFLQRLGDGQIVYLLQEEPPRIKALVLSQLSAERAALLLRQLAPAQQGQVAYEIGQFNEFPIATFRDVADRLAKKSLTVPSFENLNTDGTSLLVDMLDNLPGSDQHQLLRRIKHDSPETYYRLRKVYYTFTDLGRTPPQVLSEALREFDRKQLALALNNANPELVRYTLEALPGKLRAAIVDELKFGEAKPAENVVEQARRSIVHHLRSLIKTGRFSMDDLATIE